MVRTRQSERKNSGPTPEGRDDAEVDSLLRVASGPAFHGGDVQLTFMNRERAIALQSEFEPLVQMVIDAPEKLHKQEFYARLRELAQGGMNLSLGLARSPSGKQRIVHTAIFRDLHARLSYALLCLLNEEGPYQAALCRCKSCRKFYLAKRNPKGGPANRIYCDPEECRDKHHNSAQRKEAPMTQPVAEHFIDIVTEIFPKKAEIVRADQYGDLRLLIDWRLGTDPQRPNKRSRPIELCVGREAMSDYANGNERQRKSADAELVKVLKAKLSAFDPNHDTPREIVPTREQWIVGTQDINQ